MADRYHQQRIADRWIAAWEESQIFVCESTATDPLYILGMFPYTSGSIHMGHVRNYSITDAYARFRRMQGDAVLHPMGWDAFGLPAENAAHEHQTDPATWTNQCIEEMREQLDSLGIGYDWTREITTSEPEYYRWNQWLFCQLYEAGLVSYEKAPVNWCPSCETVLADAQVEQPFDDEHLQRNESSVDGACWRCGTPVEQRALPQWFFQITEYADELVDALDTLDDWPDGVREMQRQWIGRNEGAEITFELTNGASLSVFSSRPDTVYGATFLAVSPTHNLASQREVQPTDEERWWGHQTDIEALHPLTGETLPVWVASYVVSDVGTGAIMGVPAHNERDYAFASRHGLPLRQVIRPAEGDEGSLPLTETGQLMNSDSYSGYSHEEATKALLEEPSIAESTTYRLRDWLISRQRYWGTPIPIVHCDTCGTVPVPVEELPVTLPPFEQTTGNPLAENEAFLETTCPRCGDPALRESDTMDTFVDSSWYFLRFLSPTATDHPFDRERVADWLPIDIYVGGDEHAVLHLLYLRFITKALADAGEIAIREPIERLLTHGTVLHSGTKMSKSVGNVVSPHEYGPETTRLFVLATAHPERDFEWTAADITHTSDIQQDIYSLVTAFGPDTGTREPARTHDRYVEREIDRTVTAVTREFDRFRFHRAVGEIEGLYRLLRQYNAYQTPNRYTLHRGLRTLTKLLAPLTPFLAEALWESLGEEGLVAAAEWPAPLRDIPGYDRERALIKRLRDDVREIITVADISDPQHVTVTTAADWKYGLFELAYEHDDPEEFATSASAAGFDAPVQRQLMSDLASRLDHIEHVLPAERELDLIERAAWLLDDEFSVTVDIVQESVDADGNPAAMPNRPALDIR